jgi:hypothetical protein
MMYFKEKVPNIQDIRSSPQGSPSLYYTFTLISEYETLGPMFSLSVGHGKLGCDSCLSLRLNCMLSFFKEFDQRPKFSKNLELD